MNNHKSFYERTNLGSGNFLFCLKIPFLYNFLGWYKVWLGLFIILLILTNSL